MATLSGNIAVPTIEVPAAEFTALERRYLAGLVTALRSQAGQHTLGVPTIPATAPFDPGTRMWLDGVLAGLFSRAPASGFGAPELTAGTPHSALAPSPQPINKAAPARAPIMVLWASQTGNAEEFAGTCAAALSTAGLPVALHDMDDYPVAALPNTAEALLITSTYGDGEAPDNGARLWDFLTGADAPRLDKTRYAVDAIRKKPAPAPSGKCLKTEQQSTRRATVTTVLRRRTMDRAPTAQIPWLTTGGHGRGLMTLPCASHAERCAEYSRWIHNDPLRPGRTR